MKRNITYILVLLLTMGVVNEGTSSPSEGCVTVIAPAKLLKILDSWNPKILFFTSSSTPLRNLNEISDSGKEIGINDISLFPKAKVFGKFGGINPDAPIDEQGEFTGSGKSGNFYLNPDPFSMNSKLRLYIGWRGKDDWFVKEMRENGGVCVQFKK